MFRVVGQGGAPLYDLVTVNADGSGLRVVIGSSRGGTRPDLFGRASWSPDGKRLVFATDAGFARSTGPLYIVDADGSHPHALQGTSPAFAPVWSSDGETIVFARRVSFGPEGLTSALWSVRPDGKDPRQLVKAVQGQIDVPSSWSPDGSLVGFTRVAFKGFDSNARDLSDVGLYVMHPDGSGIRKLVERGAEPSWSPDGHLIAYVSDRDRNGKLSYGDTTNYANELYVMRSDGTASRRLTTTKDLNEGSPSWSPDGSRIAFQRGKVIGNAEGTIVLVANADGSCPRSIAADSPLNTWYATPTWRPGRALRGAGRLTCP
jgi:Tol biopolymer transport system component